MDKSADRTESGGVREILSLIPQEYRKGCINVALLVPVKAVLDLIGVAVLLPVMMLVLDPEKLQASLLGSVSEYLDFGSQVKFTAFVILSVIAVLLVKIFLSILITNYQKKFLLGLYRNLSSKLFVSLFSRGLIYIKNQNSSRMTFNVIGVCYNFVMSYLGGWMGLVGEVAFVILLLTGLFIYSAKATAMAICAFIPVMILYILLIRKPLRDMSRKENEMRREQNKMLYEAFRGYSEVQVNDAFPQIQRRFKEGLNEISRYRIRSGIIQSIPSYMLEMSVVMVVAILMMFNFYSTTKISVLFLGVFSVALLKLLPAIRGIMGSITSISVTRYTCEVIADIKTPASYKLLHKQSVPPIEFDKEISVDNLSFQFPDDEKPLFENLTFSIPKGCRFGIKGRTGSGKTTLFNILLGLYIPKEGGVSIDGVPITLDNVARWHKIIGYVPQEVFVADTTILENVALGLDMSDVDRDKAMAAIEQASLGDFVASLPDGIDSKIGENGCRLSGGQRQRLGIARALYKDAQVLFFDEATSALDNQTENEVNKAIATLSETHSRLTVIVISHRDSTLSFCDHILEIG